jgi:hypothetical protein
MTQFSIEAIEAELQKEVRCDEQGRGFYTIRGASRLAGVDDSSLGKSIKTGAAVAPSKLAKFLIARGFEGAVLAQWHMTGVPDIAVMTILEYFTFEAGAYCNPKAAFVYRFIASVGIRTLSHKITGWKPIQSEENVQTYKKQLLQQLLEEMIPEKPTTWQCRYTKEFWDALEDVYGLKQGHHGCAAFIANYIYGYFPPEVQTRLDAINPLLADGTRANRQHQHFEDELLQLLVKHISNVTFLLKASDSRTAFKKSMRKIKKFKFNDSNIRYLKAN